MSGHALKNFSLRQGFSNFLGKCTPGGQLTSGGGHPSDKVGTGRGPHGQLVSMLAAAEMPAAWQWKWWWCLLPSTP